MKRRWIGGFILLSSVTLLADEAPPAELLKNMDFFQNMDMVQDSAFLAVNNQDQSKGIQLSTASVTTESLLTTAPVTHSKGDSHDLKD